MDIRIRTEQINDYKQTEEIFEAAFLHEKMSDQSEHRLVARLRKTDDFIAELSLVAIDETNRIVGHILLSKITIGPHGSLALAPVSFLPDKQKEGIASKLVHTALEKEKKLGFQSVIVLGHSDYYPKFGFEKASKWKICAPFDLPDEFFIAR